MPLSPFLCLPTEIRYAIYASIDEPPLTRHFLDADAKDDVVVQFIKRPRPKESRSLHPLDHPRAFRALSQVCCQLREEIQELILSPFDGVPTILNDAVYLFPGEYDLMHLGKLDPELAIEAICIRVAVDPSPYYPPRHKLQSVGEIKQKHGFQKLEQIDYLYGEQRLYKLLGSLEHCELHCEQYSHSEGVLRRCWVAAGEQRMTPCELFD